MIGVSERTTLTKLPPNVAAGRLIRIPRKGGIKFRGCGKVVIGSFCSFGQDVKIISSNHDTEKVSNNQFLYSRILGVKPEPIKGVISIGYDCWIGDNVIILPKANIGTGAVIGAGSVVTGEIPPYSIAAGNPARVIRLRFEPGKIERLLKSQWWFWEDVEIQEQYHFFMDSRYCDKCTQCNYYWDGLRCLRYETVNNRARYK